MKKVSKRKPSAEPMSDTGMMETVRVLVDGSGLSRYEISRRTGIAESILSRNYNRQRTPSPETIQRIAEAVGAKVTIGVAW